MVATVAGKFTGGKQTDIRKLTEALERNTMAQNEATLEALRRQERQIQEKVDALPDGSARNVFAEHLAKTQAKIRELENSDG